MRPQLTVAVVPVGRSRACAAAELPGRAHTVATLHALVLGTMLQVISRVALAALRVAAAGASFHIGTVADLGAGRTGPAVRSAGASAGAVLAGGAFRVRARCGFSGRCC